MINPDGVRHQIHGNVIQSTSRALMEEVAFERGAVAAREWGAYPIITFPEVPKIDVLMLPRPDQPPLGVGESASVPSAAAIANAIFDATGVRFREPPFTPERILRGLHGDAAGRRRSRCPRPHAAAVPHLDKSVREARAACSRAPRRVCAAAIGIGAAAAAVARHRADRAARCLGLFGRDDRARRSSSPRSAIARSATPPIGGVAQCRRPRRWRRRSARSTRPTSRPMSRPASAPGPIPPSSARCARASSRRPPALSGLPLHAFRQDRAMPTCRRSMPI